ncbi:MAG: ion transporter [Pseudomonadota bacterium]
MAETTPRKGAGDDAEPTIDAHADLPPWRAWAARLCDDPRVSNGIIAVILINAVTLGLETSPTVLGHVGALLLVIDKACLAIFVVELALKLIAQGPRFFRHGWNLFDFVIVVVSLLPAGQGASVLRALRVLRVLRLITAAPRLRRTIEGFVSALPGMGSVFLLMAIIFYVAAVMATKLFGAGFPEWFGTIGLSAYTLFQIMTLESWSMGIVRPIMDAYPLAWAFFVPFIALTTFTVVNLLVGLIVNSMQDAHAEESNAATDAYRDRVLSTLASIEARLDRLEREGKDG